MQKKKTIDDEINRVIEKLGSMEPETKDYESASKNLEGLCRARSCKTDRSIDPDTIILALTNILGILLILNYEKLNVVSSKTLGLILKGHL